MLFYIEDNNSGLRSQVKNRILHGFIPKQLCEAEATWVSNNSWAPNL